MYAAGSNVTASFVLFEENRNIGHGAGVIAASAGSRIAVSHSQFLGSYVEKGAMATGGAATTYFALSGLFVTWRFINLWHNTDSFF